MPSSETLKIGLLGCGTIAQFAHLPALVKASGVTLAAICDSAEDLLQTVGARVNVTSLFTDYGAFLAEADMDAVLLAIPDVFHVPLAVQALKAGKHVLVEKPLGVSSRECDELIRTVRQTGLKLQVGCMKRHDPGIDFAHRFIEDRLGMILGVSGVYRDSLFRSAMQEALLPPVLQSSRSIRPEADPKTSDKCHYSLFTHGAHLFDLLRYLGGEIVGVTASLAEKFGQHTWHGLLNFDEGALGHFELSVKVNGDYAEEYVVHGENGCVEIRTFLPFYYRASDVRGFDARTQQWHTPLGACSNPYKNQLEAFARSIIERRPTNPDAADGLAALRILEAVESSACRGHRVELRDAGSSS
jgi:predicted dehydrogenase